MKNVIATKMISIILPSTYAKVLRLYASIVWMDMVGAINFTHFRVFFFSGL